MRRKENEESTDEMKPADTEYVEAQYPLHEDAGPEAETEDAPEPKTENQIEMHVPFMLKDGGRMLWLGEKDDNGAYLCTAPDGKAYLYTQDGAFWGAEADLEYPMHAEWYTGPADQPEASPATPEPADDEPPEMEDGKDYGTVDLTRPHRMERRTLPCTMDDSELAALAISMGRILREIGRIKAQHKRVAALQEQADELAYKVESGMADRLVDVCVMLDTPTTGHKQSIRMDTGEIISTAPMEEHEFQQSLFEDGERNDEADAQIIDAAFEGADVADKAENPLRLPVMEVEG